MPKTLVNPFCVTVVGARFFTKEEEKEDEEIYRYAVVGVGRHTKETDHRAGNVAGVEWGDVLQFDKSKIGYDAEIVVEVYIKWKLSSELIGDIRLPYERYKDVSIRYALLHWYPLKLDRPADPRMKAELGLIMGFYEGDGDNLAGKKFLSADDPAYDQMNADDIMVEAVKVAKENKNKVQQIARMTQQTNAIADEAEIKLVTQMEISKAVEKDLDAIGDDIILAEEKVKNMESCWTMFCGRKKAKKAVKKKANIREKAKARAAEEKRRAEEQKEKAQAKADAKYTPQQGGKALSELLVNDGPKIPGESSGLKGELQREAQEIDSGLEVVHEGVKDLKAKALSIRDNLDEDIQRFTNANNLATKDLAHINRVSDRTKRLI